MREFRRGAESAVRAIRLRDEGLRRGVQQRSRRLTGRRKALRHDGLAHALAHRTDLGFLGVIRVGSGAQHGAEAAHPLTVHRREVRAREKGQAVGSEEHREWPAALHAHGLRRAHVDGVDVGPFLAIDLHADEQLVHERGDLRILERTRGP